MSTTVAYYQDESVTLHHGDSLEILPTLDVTADVLLTDPPYFKVKQDQWDNQWDKASEFLGWMGEWLDHAKPLLAPHASVWVFASPAMTSSVERLISERFRVLNSIRWAKSGGDNLRRVSIPTMRRFVSVWEGIIFAEQPPPLPTYPDRDQSLHREIFAPVGDYIKAARESAGLTRKQVGAMLIGYKTPESAAANVANWELGKNLVSATDYQGLKQALGPEYLAEEYEHVLLEWARCQSTYNQARRPFTPSTRKLTEDIWHFPSVHHYPGKHPCEKPQPMLRHMIETSTRPGATILEPFAGSGSTILAARSLGRKTLAIEKDEAWCERIALKLSENTLDLDSAA